MPSPSQLALYATNSNRLRKAWAIARVLARSNVLTDPRLPAAGPTLRLRVMRYARVNPRMVSDHTWKLAVAIAKRIGKE